MPDEPACRFTIPRPPSTNNLHGSHIDRRTGKIRRHNTRAYKNWIEHAGWLIKAGLLPLPHFAGPISLEIADVSGIDIDNTKAIPDLLVRLGVLKDDRQIARQVTSRIDESRFLIGDRSVLVSIWPM